MSYPVISLTPTLLTDCIPLLLAHPKRGPSSLPAVHALVAWPVHTSISQNILECMDGSRANPDRVVEAVRITNCNFYYGILFD